MWQKLGKAYPPRLELLPLAMLAVSLYLTFSAYGSLPDEVPTHFNLQGVPDQWGGKAEILLFPLLSIFLYFLITGVTVALAVVNDPKKLINLPSRMKDAMTVAQAEELRVVLLRCLFALKVLILGLMAYTSYATIQVAKGQVESLGAAYIFFVGAILVLVAYMLWTSLRITWQKG